MKYLVLTRRNLETLLSKLDRYAKGDSTFCTIVKPIQEDTDGIVGNIMVTAMENEEYYIDREPGPVHPLDDPSLP